MAPVILLVATVGLTSVASSSLVGVLVAAVFLGTVALAPRLNPLVYWPAGLLVTITVGYVSYLMYWFVDMQGIDERFARLHFVLLMAILGIVALFRVWRTGGSTGRISFSLSGMMATALGFVFPAVVLWIGTSRLWSGSMPLFSGFMAGGDHGLHNEIVHDLLSWSSTPSSENPFTLYTYPRGIHFLVASLVALGSGKSGQSSLVQEYLTGAWFEYVQLAAYVQLAVAIVVFWSRERRATRAMFVAPILLVFASIPHFVGHLFWSGFTTSTGMTWALLVPVALWVGRREQKLENWHRIEATALWVLLLVFSWIVYQPYVIVISTTGFVLVCVSVWKTLVRDGRLRRGLPEYLELPACFVVSLTGAVLPYFVLGKDSAAVNFLFLDGSTWRVGVATVAMWTAAALVLPRMMAADGRLQTSLPSAVVAGLLGFTVGMAGLVFATGDHGLFDLPYYIQKMYWVILYISVPVALASGLTLLLGHKYLAAGGRRFGRQLALWLLIALVPLVQGRTPNAAVSHISVDWFANGVYAVAPDDRQSSGAFSMRDKLGSHMANLALRSASTSILTPDVAISGNPYLACADLVENGVVRIYTTPNGRAELVESGCSPDAVYLEDGRIIGRPHLEYFGVSPGVTETFTNKSLGFRLLLRGFLPPEKWGTWAGGYRSALGFDYEETMKAPSLEMVLRSHPRDEELRSVSIGVNGATAVTHRLAFGDPEPFVVPMPAGPAGTSIELTITCERTDAEVLADDPVDGPSPCAGLVSMRLVERGD